MEEKLEFIDIRELLKTKSILKKKKIFGDFLEEKDCEKPIILDEYYEKKKKIFDNLSEGTECDIIEYNVERTLSLNNYPVLEKNKEGKCQIKLNLNTFSGLILEKNCDFKFFVHNFSDLVSEIKTQPEVPISCTVGSNKYSPETLDMHCVSASLHLTFTLTFSFDPLSKEFQDIKEIKLFTKEYLFSEELSKLISTHPVRLDKKRYENGYIIDKSAKEKMPNSTSSEKAPLFDDSKFENVNEKTEETIDKMKDKVLDFKSFLLKRNILHTNELSHEKYGGLIQLSENKTKYEGVSVILKKTFLLLRTNGLKKDDDGKYYFETEFSHSDIVDNFKVDSNDVSLSFNCENNIYSEKEFTIHPSIYSRSKVMARFTFNPKISFPHEFTFSCREYYLRHELLLATEYATLLMDNRFYQLHQKVTKRIEQTF